MRRLALSAILLFSCATGAQATCNGGLPGLTVQTQSTPSVVTTPFEVSQSTNGNCQSNVFIAGASAAAGSVTEGTTFSGLIANAIMGRAQNGERSPVSNGQTVGLATDLYGKLITSPWANRENFVSGSASTSTNTATTLIPAQGVGIKIYVTSAQCFRTDAGTSMAWVALNDSAGTTMPLSPNGGAIPPYGTPLVMAAANTPLQFTVNTSSGPTALNSVFCNAQGFNGA